jgi:hypothetical protein
MAVAKLSSGNASITLALDNAIQAVDKITGGAASSFRRIVTEEMQPIEAEAKRLWPRRTGRSANAIDITTEIKAGKLYVSLGVVDQPYARYVRFSRFTMATLKEMATVNEERGNSGPAKLAIVRYSASKLYSRHGRGAPTAELVSKFAMTELMRKPGQRLRPRIVERAAKDLATLAGRA